MHARGLGDERVTAVRHSSKLLQGAIPMLTNAACRRGWPYMCHNGRQQAIRTNTTSPMVSHMTSKKKKAWLSSKALQQRYIQHVQKTCYYNKTINLTLCHYRSMRCTGTLCHSALTFDGSYRFPLHVAPLLVNGQPALACWTVLVVPQLLRRRLLPPAVRLTIPTGGSEFAVNKYK